MLRPLRNRLDYCSITLPSCSKSSFRDSERTLSLALDGDAIDEVTPPENINEAGRAGGPHKRRIEKPCAGYYQGDGRDITKEMTRILQEGTGKNEKDRQN
ncbi:hypothetical protein RB195_003385 [Necator americanus]|uniref:Uncharacterized protein n=1 Tax=Necator americanus TaxID=51031 RepID=A0ABR1DNX9_NECAM